MLGRSGREERGRINEIVGKTLLIAAASGCSSLFISLCFSRLFATIFERGKTEKEKVWTLVETPIERLPAETPCFAINGYSVPRTRSSFYRLNWFTFVPCFLSL